MPVDPVELKETLLKQTYKLKEIIGQSRMSVVFRAVNIRSQQPVAVKILWPGYSTNSDAYRKFLRRFDREIKIILRFRHANIMPIYDYGNQDGLTYLVMPYITGGTLSGLLAHGTLPAHQALMYIEQAASALDYAHNEGVIHRDVKPGNFLIDEHGQLLLADFGIAHVIGDTFTQEGEFIGTRVYAPPEALFDGYIDGRADIYSLGVVLCEMLTGYTPAEMSDTCPTLSPGVDSVIRRATARNPQERYSSAREMAAALRFSIEREHNEPTLISRQYGFGIDQDFVPTPPIYPVHGGRKRSRLLLFSIILFLIVLSSAGILMGLYFTNANRPGSTQLHFQTFSPAPTPTPSPGQQAQGVVLEYYALWNQGNYRAAYNLLSQTYQASHSYAELHYYYIHTHRSCATVKHITTYSTNYVMVNITDVAIEDNASATGKVTNMYKGDFAVKLEAGSWRLTPQQDLHWVGSSGTC